MSERIFVEVERVNDHSQAMLSAYLQWGSKIVIGDTQYWMYNELIDFLNFRMETAESCKLLITQGRVADALGLSRSILENYLLFMLMCRGTKYFRLEDRSDLSEGDFKRYVKEQQEKLEESKRAGTAKVLAVEKYSRAKRRLMYVSEGLKSSDGDELVVPLHYFHFQQFRPEVMRLKRGDYFEYFPLTPENLKAAKSQQQDAAVTYQAYLSYDGC